MNKLRFQSQDSSSLLSHCPASTSTFISTIRHPPSAIRHPHSVDLLNKLNDSSTHSNQHQQIKADRCTKPCLIQSTLNALTNKHKPHLPPPTTSTSSSSSLCNVLTKWRCFLSSVSLFHDGNYSKLYSLSIDTYWVVGLR